VGVRLTQHFGIRSWPWAKLSEPGLVATRGHLCRKAKLSRPGVVATRGHFDRERILSLYSSCSTSHAG